MHELAISETICRIIEQEAKRNNITKVTRAKLRIGAMNAFQRENLDLCLRASKSKALFSDLSFEIEETPVEVECGSCRKHFTDHRFDEYGFAHRVAHAPGLYIPPPCPSCGHEMSKVVSGNEMELVSIGG